MAISKVVYYGNTLIDLTSDTVDIGNLLQGYTAHGADGNPVHGECTFDCDTSDATATASEILATKKAYNKGNPVIGTMPNRGGWNVNFTDAKATINIPAGYHDGSGTISLTTEEENKFIESNIRQGVVLLGVKGTMTGSENVNATTETVTPLAVDKTYTPSNGYTHFTEFTVKAIPYVPTDNSAGGTTITIG